MKKVKNKNVYCDQALVNDRKKIKEDEEKKAKVMS